MGGRASSTKEAGGGRDGTLTLTGDKTKTGSVIGLYLWKLSVNAGVGSQGSKCHSCLWSHAVVRHVIPGAPGLLDGPQLFGGKARNLVVRRRKGGISRIPPHSSVTRSGGGGNVLAISVHSNNASPKETRGHVKFGRECLYSFKSYLHTTITIQACSPLM